MDGPPYTCAAISCAGSRWGIRVVRRANNTVVRHLLRVTANGAHVLVAAATAAPLAVAADAAPMTTTAVTAAAVTVAVFSRHSVAVALGTTTDVWPYPFEDGPHFKHVDEPFLSHTEGVASSVACSKRPGL